MNPAEDPDLKPINHPAADPATSSTKAHKPKQHVLLIVAGLVVLFGAIGVIAWRGAHKTTKPAAPVAVVAVNAAPAEVSITANGLTPATVQIKPGAQVTWTNSDTKNHQIAADPYPADSSIDGFDSTTVLSPNDTISFTFAKAGTYTYHDELDHTNKAYQGTIVVK